MNLLQFVGYTTSVIMCVGGGTVLWRADVQLKAAKLKLRTTSAKLSQHFRNYCAEFGERRDGSQFVTRIVEFLNPGKRQEAAERHQPTTHDGVVDLVKGDYREAALKFAIGIGIDLSVALVDSLRTFWRTQYDARIATKEGPKNRRQVIMEEQISALSEIVAGSLQIVSSAETARLVGATTVAVGLGAALIAAF